MFSLVKRRIRRYKSKNPYSNQLLILVLEGIIFVSKVVIVGSVLLISFSFIEKVKSSDNAIQPDISLNNDNPPPREEPVSKNEHKTATPDMPEANELRIKREGNTAIGTAGSDWTESELSNNAFSAVCQGNDESVTEISIDRDKRGVANFVATCTVHSFQKPTGSSDL